MNYPNAPQMTHQYPPQYLHQYPQSLNQQTPVQQYPYQYLQQGMMYQQPMLTQSHPFLPDTLELGNTKLEVLDPALQQYNLGRQEIIPEKISGFQKLEEQPYGIFVKQKIEFTELVLGCETQNVYNVHGLNQRGERQGHKLFKCKERSGICARACLSGDCRPFQMSIATMQRGGEDDPYEPFLRLERPCTCTCLCFNRPFVRIILVEDGKNEYIGKIIDPFNWCQMELCLYDQNDYLKYNILGNCCQLGVWCRCPCEPCQTIDFDVKTSSGEIVSHLQKKTPGFLKAALTDVDSFALEFPRNSLAIDKALLMCAVLFLDYRHFERNANNGE